MIFEPFSLKGIEFKNRLLRSSVGGRMSAYNGVTTDIWKNFEKRFADGGLGGIVSTTFIVDPDRQSPFEYPSIAEDKVVRPLKRHIAEIKTTGCRYIVQLGDPGYATHTSLFAQRNDELSSSNGFDLLYGYGNRRIAMTEAEIEEEIDHFAKAAVRVREAGADGIEITAEKGYIIHQFLNPGFNRRTDQWGGTPEKRFRFLEEVIKAVKRAVGEDFMIGVRLSAVDYNSFPIQNFIFRFPWVFPWRYHVLGNDIDQTLAYGRALKGLGIDFLHIVVGSCFINPKGEPGDFPFEEVRLLCNITRHLSFKAAVRAAALNLIPAFIARPLFSIGWKYEEAISLPYAERFKREVGIPVIANGGFQNGDTIESALSGGKCDFVSMARALIANPDLPKRFAEGKMMPDKPCTHCNRCAGRTPTSPLGCYEIKRFPSQQAMQDQIMAWNSPDL